MSPSTSAPVTGSSGIWPEKYTVLPARTACEYGPMAAGARSVAMMLRDMETPRGRDDRGGAASCDASGCEASARPLQRITMRAADHAGAAHATDHLGQMAATLHLHREQQRGRGGIALDVLHVLDVGVRIGDRRGDRGQHAGAIDDLDAQLGAVVALHIAIPLDRHLALGRLAQFGDVRALLAVDHDALAGGEIANDLVAGQRMAAVGEAEHAALGTGDADLLAARRRGE